MKKILLFGLIGVGILAALGTTGMVYAQTQLPPTQTPGNGSWMFGGWGGLMGGMMGGWGQTGSIDSYGPMHDDMIAAFASGLGLSVAEVNTRLANGETLYQIALDEGKTSTESQTLIVNARNTALDQLVADGTLTSQQADWMKQHMAQMSQYGFGPGSGGCGGFGGASTGATTGSRGGMMRNRTVAGQQF